MESKEEIEHLSYLDDSEGSRYRSRAVLSDVGFGVEIEDYEGFTVYSFETDTDVDELIDAIEPYFPLNVDPALEMVKKEGRIRRADREHDTVSSDAVYDPVRDWRDEDRWGEYSLVQVNLNGAKVVHDEKGRRPRVRVYELEDTDIFEKLFSELMSEDEATDIVEEVRELSF